MKKVFLLLPVLAGLLAGHFFNQPEKAGSESIIKSPAVSPETSLPKQVPHSISHYLLTSQTLFSKAIELSTATPGTADTPEESGPTPGVERSNHRIVELVNEAINQATQAILHYPADPRGWAQRAKIYTSIEKYVEGSNKIALIDLQKAVELSPQNSAYLKDLSSLWLESGNLNQAIISLSLAARADPTNAQIWFDLARLQTKAGQLSQAKRTYQKVLPLLANQEQKQVVKKELGAIENLLAQVRDRPGFTPDRPGESRPTPGVSTTPGVFEELELPNNPPKLEATNLSGRVIIAEPKDEPIASKQSSQIESNALSGNALLPAGQTEMEIENSQLTAETQVYLSAIGDSQNQVLRVKSKGESSFIITIKNPLEHDLEFKWWLIK